MLLWASKFDTAKIICIIEMGEYNTFWGNIYFAGDDACLKQKKRNG